MKKCVIPADKLIFKGGMPYCKSPALPLAIYTCGTNYINQNYLTFCRANSSNPEKRNEAFNSCIGTGMKSTAV